MKQHKMIPSTLGHGETMCKYCFATNRELAVLGWEEHCEMAPEQPAEEKVKDEQARI